MGTALARQVRSPERTRSPWPGSGRGSRSGEGVSRGRSLSPRASGVPAWEAGSSPCSEQARAEDRAEPGRTGPDRPAGHHGLLPAVDGLGVSRGASPTPGAGGMTHANSLLSAETEPDYSAVIATVPNGIFTRLLGDKLRGALASGFDLARLESVRVHGGPLCPPGARPQPDVLLLAERRRARRTRIHRPGGAHEPGGPGAYGGRRFLYMANYVAPDDALLALDDALLDVTCRACVGSTRSSRAGG